MHHAPSRALFAFALLATLGTVQETICPRQSVQMAVFAGRTKVAPL